MVEPRQRGAERRHARPDRTSLFFRREASFLVVQWENDGFTPTDGIKSGNGLRNIGQRVQQLEGTWNYRIHRGRNWQVNMEIPFTALFGPLSVPTTPSIERVRSGSPPPIPPPEGEDLSRS